jgi:hypothetical protein
MGESYAQDPDFLKSPLTSFGGSPQRGLRTTAAADAEIIQDRPLRMRYTDLDRTAHYKLRITYGGDARSVPVRLTANSTEIHPFRAKGPTPVPVEFDVPQAVTATGTMELEWTRIPGLGGNGRGTQVSEVWLMKVTQ